MDFRGHLRLPDDAGTGIPVVLRLDDIFVIISAGDDELGAWRADDVEIERIFSNQFAIELDGESMVFVAQDALGFAYEGITAIEDLQERLTKRGIFRRARKKDKKAAPADVDAQDVPPTGVPEPVTPEPSRRPAAELVSHLDQQPAADVVVPDLQPASPPSSTPLWTPATAKAVPAEQPAELVDPPMPAERPVSDTRPASVELPADNRVSYPRTPVPAPPSVDSFVPPEPEDDPTSPIEEVRPEPVPGPAAVSWPRSEPEPRSEPVPPPEPEPVSQPAPRPVPEYEIEEVTAASSGASWDQTEAVPQAAAEIEIEIEDYFPPTAGAVETFVAPQSVPEPAPALPEAEGEPDEVPEAFPEPQVHAQPDLAEPAPPIPAVAEDDSIEPEVAPAQPEAAAPADEAANGHKAEKRRSFLFGRGRDKSVPVHEHEYGEPKTIGGLTRAVCGVCGHVTFSGQDVYQDW